MCLYNGDDYPFCSFLLLEVKEESNTNPVQGANQKNPTRTGGVGIRTGIEVNQGCLDRKIDKGSNRR